MWGKDLIYFSQIGNQLLKNVLMKIYAYSMKKSTLLNAISETNFNEKSGNSLDVCLLLSHIMFDSLRPHQLYPARFCPRKFSEQEYWSG